MRVKCATSPVGDGDESRSKYVSVEASAPIVLTCACGRGGEDQRVRQSRKNEPYTRA